MPNGSYTQDQGQTLDKYFALERRVYQGILERGIRSYMLDLPELWPVFLTGRAQGCCIDSRISLANYCGNQNGHVQDVPSAGALLLLAHENIDKAERFVACSGLDTLYSHSRCGAGLVLYKELHDGNEPATLEDWDDFVSNQTRRLTHKLGVEYGGFIGPSKLRKSPDTHPVRSVAYVGSKAYSPFNHLWVPPSFRISRRVHLPGDAATEVLIATNIAFGHEGYGNRLTPENPFVWFAIGDADNGKLRDEDLLPELQNLHEKLDPSRRECVKIDGFNWSANRNVVV